MWIYTSTPPYAFMAWINLIFQYPDNMAYSSRVTDELEIIWKEVVVAIPSRCLPGAAEEHHEISQSG
jgi:hypothetical protein